MTMSDALPPCDLVRGTTVFLPKLSILLALTTLGTLHPIAASAADRGLLRQVVHFCVLNHRITGDSFPCLEVVEDFRPEGFVVLRPPDAKTHVVLAPTEDIPGVEDVRLQGPTSVNLFQEAWLSRRYVEDW